MASDISIVWLPCYHANGSLAASDIQCNPDGQTSACCAPGYQCVNNLYCRRGSVNKPGSCTDENWLRSSNPACPCPSRNDTETYLSNTILCSTETFLCDSAGGNEDRKATDCFDPEIMVNPIIDYGNGLGVPASTDAIALKAYYSGLAVSTASVPSRTSSSSTSSPSTPAATSTAAKGAAKSGLSGSSKIALGVGIGIGVPLILLAATIVFLLIRRRGSGRREHDSVSLTNMVPGSPAPEYKADKSPQQMSGEMSIDHSDMAELPSTRPTGELQAWKASPAELDGRYTYGR
ncbi:uncharacterized protein RCC_00035 [Ramularia collo-cygni]|uniref:Mid2 domain-containing protein n=1 Tax=Ramularia collo-cygni TaxID=112498 RepID=A0A2D3UPX8_9PEZI|nr:uncharacterized protein RCC_00035 [Ramularia collo-cygni]CZT14060.1 uncharacterized protein RCC_00035 [Ramularia collo-cygni]